MRQVNQRLSVVGRQRITATLTGYAYETIPGKAIIAGATKGPDDGEPSASFTTPTSRTRHARRTGNGSTWTVDLARKESADIELVAQGLKNSEIAQAIGTTEFVVKSRI